VAVTRWSFSGTSFGPPMTCAEIFLAPVEEQVSVQWRRRSSSGGLMLIPYHFDTVLADH